MSGAGRIDTHQHLVPPRYAAWLRDRGVRPGGRELPDWSPTAALRFMDGHDIDAGVLSLSTPGVWLGDDAEARRWAREVNEYAAEVRAANPGRFGFLATLPLPDVAGALAEVEHALDVLRADGVALLANHGGRYLGDPVFEPLLEVLHRREAVVFVHPGELPGPGVPGIPSFAADFLLDTTRAAVGLVLSGAMERYPGIRIVLAHAGGFVPYIAYRILLAMLDAEGPVRQALTLLDQERRLRDRLTVLRRFHYDVALSSTPSALPSLLEVADPARITYGSDFPFAPRVAVRLMSRWYEDTPLAADLRAAIDRGNAARLFAGRGW